jgi:hypothetical protein
MWWQQDPRNKYPWKPGTPIYVCKRKKEGCTGVIWEPRAAQAASRPASAKPWVETETIEEAIVVAGQMARHPPATDVSILLGCLIDASDTWDKLNELRREAKKESIPLSVEAVAASAHTLFIKRTRN